MNEKLGEELVERLIKRELENSEREGMDLFLKLSSPYIGEEELEQRLKAVRGYRVWWSTDSSLSLSQVKINHIEKSEGGLCEVSARCVLSRCSAHHMYEEGEPLDEIFATVSMKVTDTLEIKDFNFRWGK